jgi:hypothetical protein
MSLAAAHRSAAVARKFNVGRLAQNAWRHDTLSQSITTLRRQQYTNRYENDVQHSRRQTVPFYDTRAHHIR